MIQEQWFAAVTVATIIDKRSLLFTHKPNMQALAHSMKLGRRASAVGWCCSCILCKSLAIVASSNSCYTCNTLAYEQSSTVTHTVSYQGVGQALKIM